jgi:hypothetical protein
MPLPTSSSSANLLIINQPSIPQTIENNSTAQNPIDNEELMGTLNQATESTKL